MKIDRQTIRDEASAPCILAGNTHFDDRLQARYAGLPTESICCAGAAEYRRLELLLHRRLTSIAADFVDCVGKSIFLGRRDHTGLVVHNLRIADDIC